MVVAFAVGLRRALVGGPGAAGCRGWWPCSAPGSCSPACSGPTRRTASRSGRRRRGPELARHAAPAVVRDRVRRAGGRHDRRRAAVRRRSVAALGAVLSSVAARRAARRLRGDLVGARDRRGRWRSRPGSCSAWTWVERVRRRHLPPHGRLTRPTRHSRGPETMRYFTTLRVTAQPEHSPAARPHGGDHGPRRRGHRVRRAARHRRPHAQRRRRRPRRRWPAAASPSPTARSPRPRS